MPEEDDELSCPARLGGITDILSATKEEVLPLTGRSYYPQCPCMPEEDDELSCPAQIRRDREA
jgi:hypothetical protein